MSRRELLFSITKDDFKVETFRSSGKGGQNLNKRDTAVRITHPESGAVGQSQDERSQHQNKKKAFERLVASEKFQRWYKMECARRLTNQPSLDEWLDEQMKPANLKVEYGSDTNAD